MKIDLSTPYKDIEKTFDRELDKAIYWYNKKSGDEKDGDEMMNKLVASVWDDPEHKPRTSEIIDWTSPDGNKWMIFYIFQFIRSASGSTNVYHNSLQLMWFETVNSAGLFARDYDDVLIFTPHFFYRYKERMNITTSGGRDDILQFILNNPFIVRKLEDGTSVTYKKNGQTQFFIALADGLGIGALLEDGKRFEVRTFIPKSWMYKEQRDLSQPLFDLQDKYISSVPSATVCDETNPVPAYWDCTNDIVLNMILKRYPASHKNYEIYRCITLVVMYLGLVQRHVDIVKRKTVFFLLEYAIKISEKYNFDRDMCVPENKELVQILTELSKELYGTDITEDQMRKAMEEQGQYLEDYDKEQSVKNHQPIIKQSVNQQQPTNNETMSPIVMTALKKCLKKAGIKSTFSTLVKNFCRGNAESFVMSSEAEYVISRVATLAKGDTDSRKFREANKIWMATVIDNGWCSAFNPYIEKYGKELVKISVCDMIDHDNWWSPSTNACLKGKNDDYIHAREDAFRGIGEDIETKLFNDESLKELLPGFTPTPTPASETAKDTETPVQEQISESATTESQSNQEREECKVQALIDFGSVESTGMFCSPEVAQKSSDNMLAYLERMSECAHNVASFISERNNESAIQKAYEQQKKEVERLQKLLEDQKAKTTKMENQRDTAQACANMRFTEIEKLKKEKAQIESEKEALSKKYKTLQEEHDVLKEAAQRELPRKKTINLSKLVKFANMGTFDRPSKSCTLLVEQIFPIVDVVVDMKH